MASAILVTTSDEIASNVSNEIDAFVKQLSRKEIIQKSLDNYGYILVADSMEEAIEVANDIASEHLEIVTKNPFDIMTKLKMRALFFLGITAANHLVIILQVQIMSCQQMAQPSFLTIEC